MSRVDDLIARLCPGGVPLRTLGEVGEFTRGRRFTKDDYVDSGLGVIHYGEIYTDYSIAATATRSFVRHELRGRLRLARKGDLVIAGTGENVQDVCKAVAWLGEEQIAIHDDCYIFRHQMDPTFASYLFQSTSFQQQKVKFVSESKVVRISSSNIAKIKVLVPPIEVQREIVNILNTFTQLQSELQSELDARKKQRLDLTRLLPDSARIRLLSPDGVERVRIGEVATQSIEPIRVELDETYVNLGVRWYGEGAFARDSRPGSAIKGSTLYRTKPGQFIYNRMFVIEGSFGVITPELAGGVVSNEFPVYDLDPTRLLPGWLMICLLDEYTLKRVAAEVTGVERGSMKSRRRWKEQQFEAFQIDLPSVAAQQEMLRILGLCMDLELALGDERAGRRRQYEYYRDKMLSLKEHVA